MERKQALSILNNFDYKLYPNVPFFRIITTMNYSVFLAFCLSLLFLILPVSAEPNSNEENDSQKTVPSYAQRLAPKIEEMRQEMMVPGVVVYIQSAELGDWSQAFGTRDLAGDDPLQVTDHFRVGSSTKTWTGTVVLQLVDEGLLNLNDPISRYIEGVPNGDEITIEHLLNMHSGLLNYTDSQLFNEQLDSAPSRVWRPTELLALAFEPKENTLFEPGKMFRYSNTNTILLGLVIEKLTDKSVEENFKERLFDPLQLSHTSLPSPSQNEIPTPHARGYQYHSNIDIMESNVLSDSDQKAAKEGTLRPLDLTDVNPSWGWTAGSGISTAPELARLVRNIVEGDFLSPELQARRLEYLLPAEPNGPAYLKLGLGLVKTWELYGHTGEISGFTNFMGHDPKRDLTIIVWTNLAASPQGELPPNVITEEILRELY